MNDKKPDLIWLDEKNHVWLNGFASWTKYIRVDVAHKAVHDAAAIESDAVAERIAQLEADLKEADEEARTLRNMVCDEWRKHAEDATMPDLHDENQRLWNEFVQLAWQYVVEQSRPVDVQFRNNGLLVWVNDNAVGGLSDAIAYLRALLAPKPPQRPTAEQLINGIARAIQDIAEGQVNEAEENLRVMVERWDAAEKSEAEHAD